MSPLHPKLADNKRKYSDDEESVDLVENEEVVTNKLITRAKLKVQGKPDVDQTKEAISFRNESPGEPGDKL